MKVKAKAKKEKVKKHKKVKVKKLKALKDELRKLVVSTHSLFTPTPAPKQAARGGIIFF